MTKVLYLGDQNPSSTSFHRKEAIRRLGFEVVGYNPGLLMPRWHVAYYIHYRLGFRLLRRRVHFEVCRQFGATSFDCCWINACDYIGPGTVKWLQQRGVRVLCYNNDDPFGGRDFGKWANYHACLRLFDLAVVVREVNRQEAIRAGARKVFRVFMSCDEVAHAPRSWNSELDRKWRSDVSFIGTWMPERGPLLENLVRMGIPLAIWGNRWQKAPEWEALRPYWRGPAVEGDDYAHAIQGSKLCLGLLSKGNRDQHTTRTAEVPFLGTALCCEDTPEHRHIFRDGEGASFFTGARDAAAKITALLGDDSMRVRIAARGREMVCAAGMTNEQVVASVLKEVLA